MPKPAASRRSLGSPVLVAVLALAFVAALTGRALASEGRIAFIMDPATDLRGAKIATMWSNGTHVHTLVSTVVTQTVLAAPTWSCNRLWVAYTSSPFDYNPSPTTTTPEVRVVRWDGARDHAVSIAPPWPGWTLKSAKVMAWSPSGRYLIVAENGAPHAALHGNRDWLVMVDLRSGVARPFLRAGAPSYRFSSLSFTPDGHRLVVGEVALVPPTLPKPSLNRLVDVSTAKTILTYPSYVSGIDVSPDGKRLSFMDCSKSRLLRSADINFRGIRTLRAFDNPMQDWGLNWLGFTKWSMDGSRIGFNAGVWDPVGEGSIDYVVHMSSSGSNFTTPLAGSGTSSGAFDW